MSTKYDSVWVIGMRITELAIWASCERDSNKSQPPMGIMDHSRQVVFFCKRTAWGGLVYAAVPSCR
jgi:hypothetical protein